MERDEDEVRGSDRGSDFVCPGHVFISLVLQSFFSDVRTKEESFKTFVTRRSPCFVRGVGPKRVQRKAPFSEVRRTLGWVVGSTNKGDYHS